MNSAVTGFAVERLPAGRDRSVQVQRFGSSWRLFGSLVLMLLCSEPLVAEDSTLLGGYSASGDSQSADRHSAAENTYLLREGTRVGPVTGRFVRSGQRWRFLPDMPGGAPQGGPRHEAEKTSSTTYPVSSVADQLVSTGLSNVKGRAASAEMTRGALSMILVIENLMLERVANSVEEDSSELRWTVTGLVTEFRGENRLLLTTIQRAPLHAR